MLLLLLADAAFAHGSAYQLTAISGAGDHLWAITDSWGFLASHDGGETWEWFCEEKLYPPGSGLSLQPLVDVEALPDGRALLAGLDGLLLYDGACGFTRVPGLPETTTGAYPIRAFGGAYLVGVYSSDGAGAFRCTAEGCAPTSLVDENLYVKSFFVDGDTAWATTVTPDTLAGGLWRSTDGTTWTEVHRWADDSPDPYVLHARGDRLLVWGHGRSSNPSTGLWRSDDGGQTWASVVSFGSWTDPLPALAAFGGGGFLRIGNANLHVLESIDDGITWVDTNAMHPETTSLLCVSDDGQYACAEHAADGFDFARIVGRELIAFGCMDDAAPAACFAGACDAAYGDYLERGSYGGGRCEADLSPVGVDEGCGGGAAQAAVALGAGLAAWAGRRRRR